MNRWTLRMACAALALVAAGRFEAATLEFVPLDHLPPAVASLGAETEIEAFAIDAAGSIAVASIASTGEVPASALRFARGDDEPRAVPLGGRLVGLALAKDGDTAYAVVRVTGRKGALRSLDLVRVDLKSARAMSVATLPPTAAGVAVAPDGASLLIASKDEIRTFVLPAISSGPLYRALGDNVGVFPIERSSYVLVAQRGRVALVDLSAAQSRDGLALSEEASAPAPLRGLLASTGELGPVVSAEGGLTWRVRIGELPVTPVPPPAPLEVPPPPPEPSPEPPAAETAAAPSPPPVAAAPRELPGEPGTVLGVLTGAAVADVDVMLFLGPDNILREAARAAPDAEGRYRVTGLAAGAYRIVASGKGGRVLICQPPFISIRVGPNSAVEAPGLEVLRAR